MGDINCAFFSLVQGCYLLAISFHNLRTYNRGLNAVGEIVHVINRTPKIPLDSPNYKDFNGLDANIEFEDVSFSYPGRSEAVLKGISFTIEKGKTTAIVGPSGSGKSTIVKLLERFYDPEKGRLSVNGEDLKNINLRQFRRRVGYVGQEPCLLNESVKDNMLNANPNATDQEIETALETIGASEFVSRLPNQLDTKVGSVGNKLSGGQKQKLAIARAIIKNPDLLIFDEATSALDSENQQKVQEAIEEVLKIGNMTKVVIAHRLSTIINADKIILIQDGVIEGEGTHEEMMNSNNLYSELVNIQNIAEKEILNRKVFQTKKSKAISERSGSSKRVGSLSGNETNEELETLLPSLKSERLSVDLELINSTDSPQELGALKIFSRLLGYNRPKYFIVLVLLGITFLSAAYVCTVIIEMELMVALLGIDRDHMKHQMRIFVPQFLGIALLVLVIQTITRYCLFQLTASMIRALRIKLYENLLRQPAEFFDEEHNTSGNLVGTLADEIRSLNGASVEQYALFLQGFLGMVAAIAVSLAYFWQIGLITAGVVPVTALCMFYQSQVQFHKSPVRSKYLQYQKTIAADSITNYATVASMANEEVIVGRYYTDKSIEVTFSDVFQALKLSFVYAIACSSIFWMYYPLFTVLVNNVEDGESYKRLFVAVFAAIWGSLALSNSMLNGPEFSRGKRAADKILHLESLKKEGTESIDIANGPEILTPEKADGDIEFHNVSFKYPASLGDNWVLKNFNLKIRKGECLGIIGESG